jgi:hypothetical protein
MKIVLPAIANNVSVPASSLNSQMLEKEIISRYLKEKGNRLALNSKMVIESLLFFDSINPNDKDLFNQWKRKRREPEITVVVDSSEGE